jgi:hypothetical protein
MNIALTPETLAALVGVVGPLLVAAVTGLQTSSKVKTWIALAIITAFTAAQVFVGNLWGVDVLKNITIIIAVWGGFYQMWKGTEVTKWLQEKFPIYFGAARDVLDATEDAMIDDGVPAQTDNSTSADDGPQDVVQDSSVDLTEGEEIPEVL